MNTDVGEFVDQDRSERWMQRIAVGETVKVKGEELEVLEINERTITLKLLSAEDRFQKNLMSMGTAADMPGFEALADAESKRQLEKVLKHQK